MTDGNKAVYALIKKSKNGLRTCDIAEKCHFTQGGADYHIQKLRHLGLIKRQPKTLRWSQK